MLGHAIRATRAATPMRTRPSTPAAPAPTAPNVRSAEPPCPSAAMRRERGDALGGVERARSFMGSTSRHAIGDAERLSFRAKRLYRALGTSDHLRRERRIVELSGVALPFVEPPPDKSRE